MKYFKLVLIGLIVFLKSNVLWANDLPEWWGNNIGKENIVLPSFEPITMKDRRLDLGAGRSYLWNKGLLPNEMLSRKKSWVTDNRLEITIDGKNEVVQAQSFEVIQASGHDVEILTTGFASDKLKIIVKSRIEYDGLVMVDVELVPLQRVEIAKFHHVISVIANPWMKMLSFEPETVHVRQKKVVSDTKYRGRFLNAVAFVDGEKSLWWVADNAKGWVNNPDDATEVTNNGNIIELRQKLIDKKIILKDKHNFKFNFLVTPVKSGNGNIRQNRYLRHLSKAESKHHGVNIWWTTAFSHQVLPYIKYPAGVKESINKSDVLVYPGLSKNKKLLEKYHQQDVNRLPYFSAHVLNHFDPAYKKYREAWSVHPKKTWKRKYDRPFKTLRDDAYLTHRAEGYTDYLLSRFSSLIDQLGFEGLYFDQGGVMSSRNPTNGLWVDGKGRTRNSTDILALRAFHKRLATLFYVKGKKGLIFSHNSNTAIVPAYSFISAMVQGEEYIHWLKNYDYIDSVGLDEIRSRIGSSAFGVPTMWLEVIYANEKRMDQSKRPFKMDKKSWLSSSYYQAAYTNFMSLVLLHDMSTWAFAPIEKRNEIFDVIDWVRPETARFVGYWNFPKETFSNQIYFSYYYSKNNNKLLIVVSNLSNISHELSLERIKNKVTLSLNGQCNKWNATSMKEKKPFRKATIEPKSFDLIMVKCN